MGLCDGHGSVCEWTADGYGDKLPGGVDPTGPATGSFRVIRGGGWGNSPRDCRSAVRSTGDPSLRDLYLGFRLTLVAGS